MFVLACFFSSSSSYTAYLELLTNLPYQHLRTRAEQLRERVCANSARQPTWHLEAQKNKDKRKKKKKKLELEFKRWSL